MMESAKTDRDVRLTADASRKGARGERASVKHPPVTAASMNAAVHVVSNIPMA